jgi:hypothetical protein
MSKSKGTYVPYTLRTPPKDVIRFYLVRCYERQTRDSVAGENRSIMKEASTDA